MRDQSFSGCGWTSSATLEPGRLRGDWTADSDCPVACGRDASICPSRPAVTVLPWSPSSWPLPLAAGCPTLGHCNWVVVHLRRNPARLGAQAFVWLDEAYEGVADVCIDPR